MSLTQATKLKILIVEDNTLMREELLQTFSLDTRFVQVLTASNFKQASELAGTDVDLVLLDIQLPDGDGLDLVPIFRNANNKTKILVFTIFEDEHNTIKAIEYGVDGYVVKDDPNLIERIVNAVNGLNPVDSRVTKHMLSRLSTSQSETSISLTPCEQQTLNGLYRGMSYAELATHMNVSHHTVPGYIKNLYRKLDVSSRSQAVYRATQLRLVNNNSH